MDEGGSVVVLGCGHGGVVVLNFICGWLLVKREGEWVVRWWLVEG